jgi:tRNA-(ms[2]io[6]A)-hydroxylase
MLNLQSTTNDTWLATAQDNLAEILIDHAHCEKKAAGTAMNLIFAYVDNVEFVRRVSPIVTEELEHFELVIQLLDERGIRFRRTKPSSYGRRLSELVRRQEPGRAIDRCLVAALIEARSCERFAVLRDGLQDRELAEFYGSLFESEARHHSTYVSMAQLFGSEADVRRRLEELAREEARIIAEGDDFPRVHS